jgi:uncharacterized protein
MADTSKRGFASMDEDKQREIASKGGKAAHAKGTAHEFTSEEAQEAGRKGGEATSEDRERMSAIGRQGGKKSRKSGDDEENSGKGRKSSQTIDEEDDELEMMDDEEEEEQETSTRGGTREQHAKAGRQSHKDKG